MLGFFDLAPEKLLDKYLVATCMEKTWEFLLTLSSV